MLTCLLLLSAASLHARRSPVGGDAHDHRPPAAFYGILLRSSPSRGASTRVPTCLLRLSVAFLHARHASVSPRCACLPAFCGSLWHSFTLVGFLWVVMRVTVSFLRLSAAFLHARRSPVGGDAHEHRPPAAFYGILLRPSPSRGAFPQSSPQRPREITRELLADAHNHRPLTALSAILYRSSRIQFRHCMQSKHPMKCIL